MIPISRSSKPTGSNSTTIHVDDGDNAASNAEDIVDGSERGKPIKNSSLADEIDLAKATIVVNQLASRRATGNEILSNADEETETDDEDNDIAKVAAKAKPLIDELQKVLSPVSENNPQTTELIKELKKICDKSAEQAQLQKTAEKPVGEVLTRLQSQHLMLTSLEAHGKTHSSSSASSSASSSSVVSSPSTESSQEQTESRLLVIHETLGAFSIASDAIRNNSSVPTRDNKNALTSAVQHVKGVLEELKKDKTIEKDLREAAASELEMKLQELEEIQRNHQDYQSPGHKKKLVEERLLFVDTACEIFEDMLRSTKKRNKNKDAFQQFEGEAKNFLACLNARRQSLRKCIGNPDLVHVEPYEAGFHQKLNKREMASFQRIKLDDAMPETALMESVIDTFLLRHPWAGFPPAKEMMRAMKGDVLNRKRDWRVIQREVLLPLQAAPSSSIATQQPIPAELVKVTTTTTPAGHVLSGPDLQVLSKDSAVTGNSLKDYRQIDAKDSKKSTIAGFNSHSTTEYQHGVNVARSEISIAGSTIFSGTRHATLSAYELFTDKLKKKPLAFMQKMFKELVRPLAGVTRICTNTEASDEVAKGKLPQFSPTEFDNLWAEGTKGLIESDFIDKATNDEEFAALLRRKSALNRAHEVFLPEILGNPALLKRVQEGKPIVFTSISLITPDPLRHFLAKLFPSIFRKDDELSMRRDEVQAWKDLQDAINNGQIEIDGKAVQGKILNFSAGVNKLSLSSDFGPLGHSLMSGWNQVAEENSENFEALCGNEAQAYEGGAIGLYVTEQRQVLQTLQSQSSANKVKIMKVESDISNLQKNISTLSAEEKGLLKISIQRQNSLYKLQTELASKEATINARLAELVELRKQLTMMWDSGEYRHAGEQPYKFSVRLARVSYLIGAGLAYNCKSGKDRTAQLDLEAKLLSVQCESRRTESWQHKIVPSYTERTDLEKRQMQAFVFQDQTRTVMQRYNTGVEGSKLSEWQNLYASFITDTDDAEFIGREFRGRSSLVAS